MYLVLKKNFGFTLLELMLVVAIASIIAVLAAPSFSSSIKKNRLESIQREMLSALKLARNEAIARGNQVTVCGSADQSTCSGSWHQGWITFVDEDGDGDRASTETLVDAQYGLTGITTGAGSSLEFVSYMPTGIKTIAGQFDIGFCDADENSSIGGKSVLVTSVGASYRGAESDAGC